MKSITLRRAMLWLCVLAALSSLHRAFAQASTECRLVPLPAEVLHRHHDKAPRIRNANGTSLNWSGYAALSSLTSPLSGVVQKVTGTWVVPTVTQSSSPDTYSATWVGIDGYSSGTVEQLGTEQDWAGGQAVYYAWFEMYPKFGFYIPVPVNPGDTITASVEYIGNGIFTLSMNNLTQNASFSINQRAPQAKRSSAEWIVEAPWSAGGVLLLADFGTCKFTGCTATLNGHAGPIDDPQWQYDQIDMETSSGAIEAETSKLTRHGQAFSVTWEQE